MLVRHIHIEHRSGHYLVSGYVNSDDLENDDYLFEREVVEIKFDGATVETEYALSIKLSPHHSIDIKRHMPVNGDRDERLVIESDRGGADATIGIEQM